MSQVTTVSICRFNGWKQRYFAFKSMVEFLPTVSDVEGLTFCKLLGCGNKNGFGIYPDFGQYFLLCTWSSEQHATTAMQSSQAFLAYFDQVTSRQTIFLYNTTVHGLWGGKTPFIAAEAADPSRMVAVLTRATIRWKDMIRFWKNVPQVSNSMHDGHSPIFAVGIGEMPFRYQATFSIWQDTHAMKAYAYTNKSHADMIQKTRKIGWYSEELFARFRPYKTTGDSLVSLDF